MVVLDASPLIYLAKLDALEVVGTAGHRAVVPPSVLHEAARPELAFRFPEVVAIGRAVGDGVVEVVPVNEAEADARERFMEHGAALHVGELEVLALAASRQWLACFHERQASRIAKHLGIGTIHLVELLFRGTPDAALLEQRVRHFARLTNLSIDDLDRLLELIRTRR